MSAIAALGSMPGGAASSGTTPVSPSSLEGVVSSCQKQLADLVTCPSSKTQQGKLAMQALSERITAARAALEKIQVDRKAGSQVSAPDGVRSPLSAPASATDAQANFADPIRSAPSYVPTYAPSGRLSAPAGSLSVWA